MVNSKVLSRHVDMLGLSKRALTCLKRLQVLHVRDFAGLQVESLQGLPNCGHRTVREIVRMAKQLGVPLGGAPRRGKEGRAGKPRGQSAGEKLAGGPRPWPVGTLSKRARDRLRDLEIRSPEALARLTLSQLADLPNCGPKTVEEIVGLAERLGAPLGSEAFASPSEKADPNRVIDSLGFSKRARSTLKRLRIHRAGDLARITRSQLMNLRNCGDKTYREIADTAKKMGVKMGSARSQARDQRAGAASHETSPTSKGLALDLFHRVRDFHFSPRARHSMERLGVTYVGDLIQITADLLMAQRNCGVTTVQEIESFVETLGFTMGMDVPGWSQKDAPRIVEKNRERLKLLRQDFVTRNYRVSGDPRWPVEKEVRYVLSRLAKNRDAEVVYSWIGMTAGKLPTLDRVGQTFSLTRERVRQILVKVGRKLVLAGIPTPRLDAAIEFIADNCPSDSRALAIKLARLGYCRPSVQPTGVVRAAEFFRREARCKIEPIDRQPFFVRKEHKKSLRKILGLARRSVALRGCAAILDIARQVTEQAGSSTDADFVRKALSTKTDFCWLDKASGWFWLTEVPRSRVSSYIEKVLSASPEISTADLRSRILKHFRMDELPFPSRVLQAIRDCLGGS